MHLSLLIAWLGIFLRFRAPNDWLELEPGPIWVRGSGSIHPISFPRHLLASVFLGFDGNFIACCLVPPDALAPLDRPFLLTTSPFHLRDGAFFQTAQMNCVKFGLFCGMSLGRG